MSARRRVGPAPKASSPPSSPEPSSSPPSSPKPSSPDFAALFDVAPAAMAALGPDRRVTAANAALRSLTGRDDLVGRSLDELGPGDEEGRAVWTRADGTAVAVRVSRAATGGGGSVLQVEPRDGSQLPQQLPQEDDRVRRALAAADLGQWTWDATTDRVSLSDRAAAIFALPPGSAPTWPEIEAEFVEEDAGRAREAVEAALALRRTYTIEARLRPRAERPRTWIMARGQGLYAADGTAIGSVGIVQDVTEQEEARRVHRDREERLTVAASIAALGIFEWHVLDDRALWENERMWEIFGRLPQEGTIGRAELFGSVLHPEDVAPFRTAVAEALASNGVLHVGARIRRASDGQWRSIELAGRFQREGPGGIPGRMIGVVADVTDRRLAEERQQLLIRELHHRVKNTLATVQAIVGSTARTAPSVEAFYEAFVGRIKSLAHTHSVLTEATWQTAALRTLLESELEPYADPAGSKTPRVVLEGPDVELPSEMAVPIGMAIHELTTNATKYGAFANRRGRLEVTWSIEEDGPRQTLRFEWRERGGPPVRKPSRQGFGSRLIQRVLTAQVQAQVDIAYDPDGLSLVMLAPLPERNAALNPLATAG